MHDLMQLTSCSTDPRRARTPTAPPSGPPLPRPPHGIEWLHIPKTGTSFGNTLILWACPELNASRLWVGPGGAHHLPGTCISHFRTSPLSRPEWPIGEHLSLEGRTDEELRRVVTFLRSPASLLASLYHHIRMDLEKDPHHVTATREEICAWLPTNRWWVKFGEGMATKYVAGMAQSMWAEKRFNVFLEGSVPSAALVAEACRRLPLLAFVGITDYWDASVCLFHAQHGGDMHAVELQNVREGRHKSQHQALTEVDCGDESDHPLYQCGLWLFQHRLQAYPHCLLHLPADARPAFSQPPNQTNPCVLA